MSNGKSPCKNCGQPTTFPENANLERVNLGWCNPCFVQGRRNYTTSSGNTRWFDEDRTVDGTWTRFRKK